jgi:SAM-dependent methyltransferase
MHSGSRRGCPEPGARLLDICCGSGEFAAWIAKTHRVVGIDLSRAMLDVARNKVANACFEQKDMRTFRLVTRDFDAAVCFYNSFNQLMSTGSLRKALVSTALHLRPGGWFLFDFIEESAFLATWEFEETAMAAGSVCRLRYRYNRRTRIATCRARVGDYLTVIRQRPVERSEMLDSLAAAGFRVVSMAPVAEVNPAQGRSAVLAQRAG